MNNPSKRACAQILLDSFDPHGEVLNEVAWAFVGQMMERTGAPMTPEMFNAAKPLVRDIITTFLKTTTVGDPR